MLTDIAIKNAKPKDKAYKLKHGEGLYLLIMPNGSKLWRLRFRIDGKETMRSLGAYNPGDPEHVSIADAREERDDARKLICKGSNPPTKRKQPKASVEDAAVELGVTFESAAKQWLDSYKPGLTPKYGAVIERRVEKWLIPSLASRDIRTITGPELLRVIKQIEATGSIDLSRRMKIVAGQILRFSVAHGWADRDVSNDIRDGLAKQPPVRHRASLKEKELPEFFRRLDAYDGYPITKLALNFIMLTAVRTDELRFAPWSEIEDLEGAAPLWRIPEQRMKMDRAHLVPLAPQAVAILKKARSLYPQSELIFPSVESRSGVMSENGMLYALYYLGYKSKATVHGFRGTFSTILNENDFNSDHIEIQLSHAEEDEVRGAYNAAQWLKQRREMLAWWADFLDECRAKGLAKA